jgi:hypothetical protein
VWHFFGQYRLRKSVNMRHLKIWGIVYLTNWILFSLFILIYGDGDTGATIYYSVVVLQWIFFPLWYAILTNYLITRIDFGPGTKTILTLRIICLTIALFLTQTIISTLRTLAFNYLTWNNFQEDFLKVWGNFIPTTLLTGIMIPLLDHYLRTKNATQQSA